MGRIGVDNMFGDKPVEQHSDRGQVLFHGWRRQLVLKVMNEGGDVERLHGGQLVDVFPRAPGRRSAGWRLYRRGGYDRC